MYQTVVFFVENKNDIKINNLMVARWLNILFRRGGVKMAWLLSARNVNVTRLFTCTSRYRSLWTR